MFINAKNDSDNTTKVTSITIIDGIAIVTGMVIGPGIFKTPGLVTANSGNELAALSLWLIGGLISFIGALCYAELTSTYPHKGGEYHYLLKAYGKRPAFLFAWARMTVIQTGSIAMLSFVIGDYATEALKLGSYSSSIYAILTILCLTWVNLKGIYFSSIFQKILMGGILGGLAFVVITGLTNGESSLSDEKYTLPSGAGIGQALIFILLTYGGWNEAAYLSADIGRTRSGIVKVLFYSIGLITFIYLITNFSLVYGLGLEGIAGSDNVAADLVQKALGGDWVRAISIVIAIAALSTVNAVMITGARTNYAVGSDFSQFRVLSYQKNNIPVNAYLLQTSISIVLVALGTVTRSGFVTMVEYTAPVFWLFFLLVGISVFILRRKDSTLVRPFSVPLYPVTPFIFCAVAAYMLYASLVYTGSGAIIGVIVLLIGIIFSALTNMKRKKEG